MNEGSDDSKAVARDRKRKLRYYSNIYVVSDPGNKENEGKVFLFSYGKKIFDMIQESIKPAFENEKPINPFNFWEGRNFILKVKNKDGYPNYDSCSFEEPKPLLGGNDKILKEIWEKEYKLQEFLDPTKFKSDEELRSRLNEVLHVEDAPVVVATPAKKKEEAPFAVSNKKPASKPVVAEESDDGDDDLVSYFKKIGKED